MRLLKFVVVTGILLALTFILNTNNPFGSSIPALGKFLNPVNGFWQNAESNPAPKQLNIPAAELSAPVDVYFDQRLVPHIFAQSNQDAAYAQGYIHAMHRLWQMDLAVRAIGGRLSEVVGERAFERDRLQRKKGMVFAAENTLRAWMSVPEGAAMLEAYSAGVNAYIQQLKPADYPMEFKLLDYEPELWSPLKSALFMKNMAESLCFRHQDLEATNSRNLLGQELFDFLYPEYNPNQLPIIPAEEEFDFEALEIAESTLDSSLLGMLFPYETMDLPPAGNGSNNWAIGPEKSASGNPILCSDPHLGLTLPSIWYETHINTPTVNSYGVSLPAEPGLLIGFNDNIAWGETNVGHDVLDWYRIKWVNEDKTTYWLDGKEMPAELRADTIWIRGRKDPHIETTKYTFWGPVVYEDSTDQYRDMAMRWVAHDQPEEKAFYDLGTFWHLMAAKNHDDYKAALKGFDSPAQNFAFAAKDGDIAITVNGNLPLKREGQGRFIQDGSNSNNAWQGFIPRDQIPQVLNPERGWISSANQHSTDEDYPYYYNSEGFDDYRGRAVNLRLDSMENITVEDMQEMQNTSFGLYAKEALTVLLPIIDLQGLDDKAKTLYQSLKDWDYDYRAQEEAPVILDILDDSLYRNSFEELYKLREEAPILFPDLWRMIDLIANHPDHEIFDDAETEAKETAIDIVNLSFKEVAADYVEGTTWVERNNPSVNHLLRIDPLGHQGIQMDGNGLTINAIRRSHGPSWRMIVELGEEVNAYGVYPGGQSGNPGSKYYDNMVFQWAKGDYNKLVFPKTKEAMDDAQVLFKMTFQNEE